MQTVKKYANRKLYHTNRKQYITLDGIAGLIQAGEQVQVIDNATGDDITGPILAQVALQAGGERGHLPTGALADMIRAGGERIAGVGRSLIEGIGGAALVDAEIARRIDELQAQGLATAEEATRMRRLLLHSAAADPAALARRSDVERLSEQVEALTALIDQLSERGRT